MVPISRAFTLSVDCSAHDKGREPVGFYCASFSCWGTDIAFRIRGKRDADCQLWTNGF